MNPTTSMFRVFPGLAIKTAKIPKKEILSALVDAVGEKVSKRKNVKTINLELAHKIIEDPQAIARGYVDDNVIRASNQIALELLIHPMFGSMGLLAGVGTPHMWWIENLVKYREWSYYFAARSFSMRKWGYVCELANYAVDEDKQEKLELRWTNLEVMRKTMILNSDDEREYLELSRVLKFSAKC